MIRLRRWRPEKSVGTHTRSRDHVSWGAASHGWPRHATPSSKFCHPYSSRQPGCCLVENRRQVSSLLFFVLLRRSSRPFSTRPHPSQLSDQSRTQRCGHITPHTIGTQTTSRLSSHFPRTGSPPTPVSVKSPPAPVVPQATPPLVYLIPQRANKFHGKHILPGVLS